MGNPIYYLYYIKFCLWNDWFFKLDILKVWVHITLKSLKTRCCINT